MVDKVIIPIIAIIDVIITIVAIQLHYAGSGVL
jgi:hypothetical protein